MDEQRNVPRDSEQPVDDYEYEYDTAQTEVCS